MDGPDKRFRRGRAGAANLVPATTGAALVTTRRCLSTQDGSTGCDTGADPRRFDRGHYVLTSRETSTDEVNRILAEEAGSKRYSGVLGVSHDPLVSSDIVGDSRVSVVDLELTKVIDGDLLKVMSRDHNEWGYANQMVREALSVVSGR